MYMPNDDYIQKLIREGISKLKEAVAESTDKETTRDQIRDKLGEIGIESCDY